jgi:hydroxymethylglutaryl-CoA reductase (NADPH)
MELEENDDLSVALRMSNVNVGVVGGGTGLPAFQQARSLIVKGVGNALKSEQLAGAVAVAVLSGELSGLAALSVNQLAQAHQRLGRGSAKEKGKDKS